MGDRLGWTIFLLILFTSKYNCLPFVAGTSKECQGDCLKQDNETLSCIASESSGCEEPGRSPDSEVTQASQPPVAVTGVFVAHRYGSNKVFTIQWGNTSVGANATRRLWVDWTTFESDEDCRPDAPLHSSYSHCQTLDFTHFQNSHTVLPRWCYVTESVSTCHNVTIAEPHYNTSLTFTLKIPTNITVIHDPSSGSEWETLVGVAVVRHAHKLSVIAVLQPAPPSLNITSYKLTLVDTSTGFSRRDKHLDQTDAIVSFENLTENGSFEVRIEPRGPGCSPRCKLIKSAIFFLSGPTSTASTVTMTTLGAASPNPAISTTTTPSDNTLHKTTKATDPSVIVKPAQDQHEYTRSRNIILGTVFGALGLAILVAIIFCIYRRTRSVRPGSFQMHPFGHRDSNSSIILEDQLKNQPIVLLLYSYDCPAHEVVVTTFAYYLKEMANCEVILDIWDQHNIQEQGVYPWLVDKVDVAQYIIMICSTGARFKCARNRQVRMKHDRTLPDVFAWGVDHVAEKIRTAANATEAKNRYLSAYFDYAGKSDIPPKLEITRKFRLMKDIFSLYCHLHGVKNASHGKHGLTVDTYNKTEEGRSLHDALIDAKHFFKENPNWLGQTLESVTPVMSPSRESPPGKAQPNSGGRMVSLPSSTDKDAFLEERMKKRIREQENTLDRRTKKDELGPPPYTTPGTSPSHMPSETSSSVTSMSPLVSPVNTLKPPPNPGSNGTLPPAEIEIDDETDGDDTSQMQSDIDFIKNFDSRYTPERVDNGTSTGHFFVDLEMDIGVYTPPEDFISLASMEEEASKAMGLSGPSSPNITLHGSQRSSNMASPVSSSSSSRVNSPMLPPGSPLNSPVKKSKKQPSSSPFKDPKQFSIANIKNKLQSLSPSQSVTSIGSGLSISNKNLHLGNGSGDVEPLFMKDSNPSPILSSHNSPPSNPDSPIKLLAKGKKPSSEKRSQNGSPLSQNGSPQSGNGMSSLNHSPIKPDSSSVLISPAKSLSSRAHLPESGQPFNVMMLNKAETTASSNGSFVIDFDSPPTKTNYSKGETTETARL